MRFSNKVWMLLAVWMVMALLPMLLLPSPKFSDTFLMRRPDVPTLKTFRAERLPVASGTLLPLDAIPLSPHYSFNERVLPRSYLLSLQNNSRRIIKNWFRKKFDRYETEDISDCEVLTPECTMFRYFLQRDPLDHEDPNDKPFRKCCVEHKALRETVLWVTRKLKSANITYFLSTGTALGARRHAGTIIPWDTDIDLAVYPSDNLRVEALFHKNAEHFFERDKFGRPMFWIHHSPIGKPRDGPHVEIYYESVYTDFPHLLLPLEECIFYGEPLVCPNVKQLGEWFPSGWEVYGGGHYHGPHSCLVYENGKKIARRRC